MFNNDGYMTKGYQVTIPFDVKMFISRQISKVSDIDDTDYLQVFDLSPCGSKQQIVHTQEQPDKRDVYYIDVESEPINGKVFVIDDVDHHTYLMAYEY